jgi:hypothetical protein
VSDTTQWACLSNLHPVHIRFDILSSILKIGVPHFPNTFGTYLTKYTTSHSFIENPEDLSVAIKDIGLESDAVKTKHSRTRI